MCTGSQTIVLGPVTSAGQLVFDHRMYTIRCLLTDLEFLTQVNYDHYFMHEANHLVVSS